MILRLFLCRLTVCVGLIAVVLGPARAANAAKSYEALVNTALTEMEAGRHPRAADALKAALTLDRNEPIGLLLLGALYLHTGSGTRADWEFQRVRREHPDDALATLGAALAAMSRGESVRARTLLVALPESERETARLLAQYLDITASGGAPLLAVSVSPDLANSLQSVTADEADPLRLEVAAFAALRGGAPERGERLLQSLLRREKMDRLAEDRAVVLPFEATRLVDGGAPPLISAVGFPAETAPNSPPLSGRVALSAPRLPVGTAYAVYETDGGLFTATTNYPPYSVDWNTTRLPNGRYTLRTTLFSDSRRVLLESARTVVLKNVNAPPASRFTAAQNDALRTRLRVLLQPRPCRKAAHFALAEQAAHRGDSATALQHIECVVAIDPEFRNARQSLRNYNLAVLGPRSGIWQARTTEKIVALTFDDGPNPLPNRTPALLDALQKAKTSATFFVVGSQAERSPDLLRRMQAEGHEIGNHSYSHQNLALLSAAGVERELCRTSVTIRRATGERPRFYRPPGGNNNAIVVDAAHALGMAGAYWTVDALKFEQAASQASLVNYVVQAARPGAILLLHNAPDVTVAAIPEIVRQLRARGYRIVTLRDLVTRTQASARR